MRSGEVPGSCTSTNPSASSAAPAVASPTSSPVAVVTFPLPASASIWPAASASVPASSPESASESLLLCRKPAACTTRHRRTKWSWVNSAASPSRRAHTAARNRMGRPCCCHACRAAHTNATSLAVHRASCCATRSMATLTPRRRRLADRMVRRAGDKRAGLANDGGWGAGSGGVGAGAATVGVVRTSRHTRHVCSASLQPSAWGSAWHGCAGSCTRRAVREPGTCKAVAAVGAAAMDAWRSARRARALEAAEPWRRSISHLPEGTVKARDGPLGRARSCNTASATAARRATYAEQGSRIATAGVMALPATAHQRQRHQRRRLRRRLAVAAVPEVVVMKAYAPSVERTTRGATRRHHRCRVLLACRVHDTASRRPHGGVACWSHAPDHHWE